MKKIYSFFLVFVALIACLSCSKEEKNLVQFFPFQEAENSLWGMISPSGEILFNEEFKEKPTIVRDGRFMVRNADGLWEIYTAEAKPKKIGTEYAYASMYKNGIALVSEKGKCVSLIDVDGKTLKTLDKIDGKTIDAVNSYSEGYAIYNTDKLCGVIDEKGNKVISADYLRIYDCSDGKFIALNKKYEKEVEKDSAANLKFDVLDTSGKILFSISTNKYKDFGVGFKDGLLDVYIESKNEKCGGIIDSKGETIIKPTPKIKKVGEINGKNFTYNNGDGWGMMNVDGETLIRAKYDYLTFAGDNMLVAMTKKNGGVLEYKYINYDDEMIGSDTYDLATPFTFLDENHAIVKVSSSLYSLIDKTGKQISKLPDMVHIGMNVGDMIVESDYVDMANLVSQLKINENGVDGITFDYSTSKVINYYATLKSCYRNSKEHSATDPWWYTYEKDLRYWKNIMGVIPDIWVNFSDDIAKRNYKTKRVIDYTYGDYYWYHNEKIPQGISFTSASIVSFKVVFDNSGKMRLKLRNVFNELSSRFKNMGKLEKENNGAVVVALANGKKAIVAMEKDKVFAKWGRLNVTDEDIDEYADVKEETKHIKDYDYFENKLSDIAEVDSDSIAVVE